MHPLALLALVLAGMLLVIVLHGLLYCSRFLAICPKVKDEGDELVACTSLAGWFLSLTLIYRQVDVDAERKVVVISRRLFWFFHSAKIIPFGRIQEIDYEYEDLGPFTSLGLTGDAKDCFSVNLRLVDDSTVHLFNFLGEGDFEPGPAEPAVFIALVLGEGVPGLLRIAGRKFAAVCRSPGEADRREGIGLSEKTSGSKLPG